jgi:hypothetical protein
MRAWLDGPHSAECRACAGPDDGCELGGLVENVMLELDGEAYDRATAAPVLTPTKECRDCDGCGWTEGGATLKTECQTCKGAGEVPLRPLEQLEIAKDALRELASLAQIICRPDICYIANETLKRLK